MKRLIPILLLIAVTASSCHYFHGKKIHGDGNVVSEARPVTGFTGVDVTGAIEVIITQDSAFSVKVEIDNNLQPYIEIHKEGDVLHIHQQNNTSLRTTLASPKVYVSAPLYKSLSVSGACTIKAANKLSSSETMEVDISGASKVSLDLKTPRVNLDMSGASTAMLKGETRDLHIDGSGSTDVDAYELLTENTDVRLSGAGTAEVYASMKLDADVSGAANIRYRGKAAVNSNTSGAASVRKDNN